MLNDASTGKSNIAALRSALVPSCLVWIACFVLSACHSPSAEESQVSEAYPKNSRPTAASALRPVIIAHRGASAYRPEHTLASYQLAMDMGADFIEPDVVSTKDGVLIARHENELSGTTDVAQRPEFAHLQTQKIIDGVVTEGWFSEDFTLAEIKQLRARERIPQIRPDNTQYDGEFEIPTLGEIIQLIKDEEQRSGRRVGIYPETKHPTYFAHEGQQIDGQPIARDLSEMLVRELVEAEFTDSERVFIQSFEVANLIQLKQRWMPKYGVELPLVQLLGNTAGQKNNGESNFHQPYDMQYHSRQGDDLNALYDGLHGLLSIDEHTGYAQLIESESLQWMHQHYADALGPWKNTLHLGVPPNQQPRNWLNQALLLGFSIHPYTLRGEEVFLHQQLNGNFQSMEDEMALLLHWGIHGYFTDHTDVGVKMRDTFIQQQGKLE
jgi:glycerophosphoryl diester phosphodiesterase